MLGKCGTVLLMFLLLNFVNGRLVFAQTVSDNDARTAKVKERVAKIGKGKKIVVIQLDDVKIKGVVSAIDADSFTVTDKKTGTERRVTYSEVRRAYRAGLSVGTKIAFAAGIAVPAIIILAIFGKRYCNESQC